MPGDETRQNDITGYAIAILAIAVAALLCWSVRLIVVADVLSVITVALFSAAVLLAAWMAGTGPGFLATALGAIVLLVLLSGPQHTLALLAPRDTAVVIATTALSAVVTIVVGRLRASHAALLQGLPEIERRARDRANDAALQQVEAERRKVTAANEDLAGAQQKLQQSRVAESRAVAARAQYLDAVRLAVELPLGAIRRYAARFGVPRHQDADSIALCEEHVATLLDTVLVPARLESGLLVPRNTEVSLPEVVARAIALVRPMLEASSMSVECANLDVPLVRADGPILTQVLARLVLDEALAGPSRTLRLAAREADGRVTLECRATGDRSLTTAPPSAHPLHLGGEDMDGVVWSSAAATEQMGRMGGAVTITRVPGAESRFTVSLSTRPPNDVEGSSAPVALWPPVAFELPRARS